MNPQLSAWAPVVSAGIVALTSFLSIWFVQWKTSQREREVKEREAKEKRANRWDDFQMKTLMELQETLHQLVLVSSRKDLLGPTGTRIAELLERQNLGGERQKLLGELDELENLVGEQLNLLGELEKTRFQASVLCSRVRDEQLWGLVLDLAKLSYENCNSGLKLELRLALCDKFDEVNDRIGERLATLRPDHP